MEKIFKKNQKIFSKIILTSTVLFFVSASFVFAATLKLSPTSGTYNVGDVITVSANISSSDQSINAVSGTIDFPSRFLNVISISKTGSIIDFWTSEPAFSNIKGIVDFEGISFNPGFKGFIGKVLTIRFRVKAEGAGSLVYTKGSILANDGLGTEVLSSTGSAKFNFKVSQLVDVVEDVPDVDTIITKSSITSPTHPDQNKWYKSTEAVFSWDIDPNILASKFSFNQNINGEPKTISKPALVEKKFKDIGNEVWYFHLSLQDNNSWGNNERYRVQIDSTPPELTIREVLRSDLVDPYITISMDVSDELSGVDKYIVKVNNKEVKYTLTDSLIRTRALDIGEHFVSVTVFDNAGNESTKSVKVNVASLEIPTILDYTAKVVENKETIVVRGQSLKESSITVRIEGNKGFLIEEQINTDNKGLFTFSPSKDLQRSKYKLLFKVTNKYGGSSYFSEPIDIKIIAGLDTILFRFVLPILLVMLLLIIISHIIKHETARWKNIYRYSKKSKKSKLDIILKELNRHIKTKDGRDSLDKAKKKIGKLFD